MPSSSACEQARKTRRRALALLLALTLPGAQARPRASRPARAEPPALLLANAYQGGIALRDYWISE